MDAVPDDHSTGSDPDANQAAEETAMVLLAQRDLRAFEPVYRCYYRLIIRYCFRRLGEGEAAANATSQTFARAMAGIAGYRTGSVAAWLFTIARNVVIDLVGYRRPQVDIDALDASGGLVDRGRLPDERAIGADQRRALFTAMDRLTPEQRSVVELRLAGLSGQEIASALGGSISAVKSSQFRAYARLRTLLADEHIFGDGS